MEVPVMLHNANSRTQRRLKSGRQYRRTEQDVVSQCREFRMLDL